MNMRVLLFGEVSAGKSSFLNSLFGLPLSNVSLQRETFDIYKYISGHINDVNRTLNNYDNIHNTNREHRNNESKISDNENNNIKYFPSYHSLKNIEIIDFPGINDSVLDNDKLFNIVREYSNSYCLMFYLVEEKRMDIENDLYNKLKELVNSNLKSGNYNKLIRVITKSNKIMSSEYDNKYYHNNYVSFINSVIKYKIIEKTPLTFINEYQKMVRKTCYINKDINYDMIDYTKLKLKREYENYNDIIMDVCKAFYNNMKELQYKTIIDSELSLSDKLDKMSDDELSALITDYIENDKINRDNINKIFTLKNIKRVYKNEQILPYYIEQYLNKDSILNTTTYYEYILPHECKKGNIRTVVINTTANIHDEVEHIIIYILYISCVCGWGGKNAILKHLCNEEYMNSNKIAIVNFLAEDYDEYEPTIKYYVDSIREEFLENECEMNEYEEFFINLLPYIKSHNIYGNKLLITIFENLFLTIENLRDIKDEYIINKIINKIIYFKGGIKPIFVDDDINECIILINKIKKISDITELFDDIELYKYVLRRISNDYEIDNIREYVFKYLINTYV